MIVTHKTTQNSLKFFFSKKEFEATVKTWREGWSLLQEPIEWDHMLEEYRSYLNFDRLGVCKGKNITKKGEIPYRVFSLVEVPRDSSFDHWMVASAFNIKLLYIPKYDTHRVLYAKVGWSDPNEWHTNITEHDSGLVASFSNTFRRTIAEIMGIDLWQAAKERFTPSEVADA